MVSTHRDDVYEYELSETQRGRPDNTVPAEKSTMIRLSEQIPTFPRELKGGVAPTCAALFLYHFTNALPVAWADPKKGGVPRVG